MNPSRLLLVTQRFWPLAGGAQRLMANLAIDLAARGCEVTVPFSGYTNDSHRLRSASPWPSLPRKFTK